MKVNGKPPLGIIDNVACRNANYEAKWQIPVGCEPKRTSSDTPSTFECDPDTASSLSGYGVGSGRAQAQRGGTLVCGQSQMVISLWGTEVCHVNWTTRDEVPSHTGAQDLG